MPSREVHNKLAKILGYDKQVDRLIDLPVKWLGRKHRILFHTPEEAATIGMTIDGIKGAYGGIMHVEVDRAASADKNLRDILELWARIPTYNPRMISYSI